MADDDVDYVARHKVVHFGAIDGAAIPEAGASENIQVRGVVHTIRKLSQLSQLDSLTARTGVMLTIRKIKNLEDLF